jgi:VanZ family protein
LDIAFLDKLAHGVEYFIFGLMAIRAFAARSGVSEVRRTYTWAALCSLLFGLSDEFHQHFVPGRSADPYDLLADAVGIFLALGFHYLMLRRRRTTPRGGRTP